MNNDTVSSCSICEFAEETVGEEMICLKKGPVPPDHKCRKFRYDPFKRKPPQRRPLVLDSDIEPL